MSMESGVFPSCWKISHVSPIPKGGDPHVPSNYRPISLLPVISKLFEMHIHSLLYNSVSISDNQWGFLPGNSTTGAILSALHDWQSHLESGLDTAAVFFDLSKAFDSVPHRNLIDCLISLNVPQHLVSLISSYLFDRHQLVCVNGSFSSESPVLSGVPQGSVLGPLLFIIYVDSIARLDVSNGTIVIYADDICLYRPIKSQEDVVILQRDVNMLTSKILDLGLSLNAQKCKSITFSRRKNSLVVPIYISGLHIPNVSSVKYLGFHLSQDLSWSEHINAICSKARRKLGFIYRKFYKFSDSSTLLMLYKAFVRPLLEHGASVWDPHLVKYIQSIESVQRFATKICLKNWSIPYYERLALLNLDSLYTRRKCFKLCLLFKMFNSLAAPSFPISLHDHNYSTRSHDLCFNSRPSHTSAFLNSYYNSTVRAWNSLPSEIVHCETLLDFKKSLLNSDVLPRFDF